MPNVRLENYLKTYRKKAGLTQGEVALLLGNHNGAQVSRYERRKRLPTLRTALAWEAIFNVPLSELFAGLRESVGEEIKEGLIEPRSKLEQGGTKGNELYEATRKMRWLSGRLDDTDRPQKS
jgi:transcriptional regulator with XRE-family HTH domain